MTEELILASDNWSGASEKVALAIAERVSGPAPAYGGDDLSTRVEIQFSELFETDVVTHMVASGTAANGLAIARYARPGGIVFCHEGAHIATDEAGAVPFFGGGLMLAKLPGAGGKLSPETVAAALAPYRYAIDHFGQPVVLSLTQLNEWGLAYSVEEVAALAAVAHEHNVCVHMDGARFAGAVVATGASPADLTWRAGVDVMSFGGTKNGCLIAEAVVLFDTNRSRDMGYARQRAGHGLSKNWVIAAQFDAYLEGGHWLELAARANRAGARLAAILEQADGAELVHRPDANEVFAVLSPELDRRLKDARVVYHDWSHGGSVRPGTVRFVTSFQTTDAELDRFAALAGVG